MLNQYRWYIALLAIFFFGLGPDLSVAQTANFHPCNAQPALPICQSGYGKRIAVRRWGAKPQTMDVDANAQAKLTTDNIKQEIQNLKSETIYLIDLDSAQVLYAKNQDTARSIASITKLMTAIVILQSDLSLDERITIKQSDIDLPSTIPARITAGETYSRLELLKLALIASENSAAHALARSFTGGIDSFIGAMNVTAYELGMLNSHFADASGLASENISTAVDLMRLVVFAYKQPLLRQITSNRQTELNNRKFKNTNILIGRKHWDILLSKTGTTTAAGDCLVMVFKSEQQNLAMVLLDANGAAGARFGDAVRMRRILAARE